MKPPPQSAQSLRRHLTALAACVALAAAAAVLAHGPLRGSAPPPPPSPDEGEPENRAREALLRHAEATGLYPDRAEAAAFLEPWHAGPLTAPFRERRLVFAARRHPGGLRDVFLLRARVAPSGRLIEVIGRYPLTDTPDGDEAWLSVGGAQVAFATRFAGAYTGVTVLDLGGEQPDPEAPATARLARLIGNYLQYGDSDGMNVLRFELDQATTDMRLHWDANDLVVARADESGWAEARVDPHLLMVLDVGWLRPVETRPAVVSLLSWAVDTARGVSWIGPARIYALETVFFRLADTAQNLWVRFGGLPAEPREAVELAAPAIEAAAAPPRQVETWVPDAVAGREPDPLDALPEDLPPRISPALRGEGVWQPYHFRERPAGAPPIFWRTTWRVDAERPDAITELVLADARQVELRLVAGTEHPRSTTGAVGTGRVPAGDREATLAAFNGGFQAVHGAYGMAVDRTMFLPPRPDAATVVTYRGGGLAFGPWPREAAPLPAELRSLRQNLPTLVEAGVFNPRRARTWGFTPKGSDPIYTWRSGLGVTLAGRLLYAVCVRCSAEGLAESMIAAGADFAMHLDMNISNIGFEWWRPGAKAGQIETETLFRQMFRAGRPRFVEPHARDFFYLVRRPPFGAGVEAARARFTEPLTAAGLPLGWPPPLARGRIARPGDAAGTLSVVFMAAPRLVLADDALEGPPPLCTLALAEAPPETALAPAADERGVVRSGGPGEAEAPHAPWLALATDERGVARLVPPGTAPAGLHVRIPATVLEGRPVPGLAEAVRPGRERWLLGADPAGNLLLLGGGSPAELAETAASLGVSAAVDPGPGGGVPALRCAGEDWISGTPPPGSRLLAVRLPPEPVVPGRPVVWATAVPEQAP